MDHCSLETHSLSSKGWPTRRECILNLASVRTKLGKGDSETFEETSVANPQILVIDYRAFK